MLQFQVMRMTISDMGASRATRTEPAPVGP
jgi:hypothetical protein